MCRRRRRLRQQRQRRSGRKRARRRRWRKPQQEGMGSRKAAGRTWLSDGWGVAARSIGGGCDSAVVVLQLHPGGQGAPHDAGPPRFPRSFTALPRYYGTTAGARRSIAAHRSSLVAFNLDAPCLQHTASWPVTRRPLL